MLAFSIMFFAGALLCFLLGWADHEMSRTLMNGQRAIPQTLVIDTSGSVIGHWVGYARGRNGDRLREAIDNALK